MNIVRKISLIDWSSIGSRKNPNKSDALYLAEIIIELDEDDHNYLDYLITDNRVNKVIDCEDRQPIRITGVERSKEDALSWINATMAMIDLCKVRYGPNTFWMLRDDPRCAKDALDRDPDAFVCPDEWNECQPTEYIMEN